MTPTQLQLMNHQILCLLLNLIDRGFISKSPATGAPGTVHNLTLRAR